MSEISLQEIGCATRRNTNVDIVFVHGLGGDAVSTWHPAGQSDSFWPQWLVDDLPQARVWALGYPAASTNWLAGASGMGVLERSRNILQYLTVVGLGKRPLIFVAHSLGGLMVKQLLRTASSMNNKDWSVLSSNVKGIVFLATPNTGSSLASLATAIAYIFRPSQATLDLPADSKYLQDLGDWFRQNAGPPGLRVEAYYESDPVKGNALVVDASSANPGVTGCIPVAVDGDHFSMCKPSGRESLVYLAVRKFVGSFLGVKPWRIYSVPGYSTREVDLHDALRQPDCWPVNYIIEEGSARLMLTLNDVAFSNEFAHVFVFDLKGIIDRGVEEVGAMLDLIRSARMCGRDLLLKPVFVFYGNDMERDNAFASLRTRERDALSQYFRLDLHSDAPARIDAVKKLRDRIEQEWLVRRASLPSAL
jgi:pimeloyl-ACP methyl ester carboxylesterase